MDFKFSDQIRVNSINKYIQWHFLG
jgi:hypothetical protein